MEPFLYRKLRAWILLAADSALLFLLNGCQIAMRRSRFGTIHRQCETFVVIPKNSLGIFPTTSTRGNCVGTIKYSLCQKMYRHKIN